MDLHEMELLQSAEAMTTLEVAKRRLQATNGMAPSAMSQMAIDVLPVGRVDTAPASVLQATEGSIMQLPSLPATGSTMRSEDAVVTPVLYIAHQGT